MSPIGKDIRRNRLSPYDHYEIGSGVDTHAATHTLSLVTAPTGAAEEQSKFSFQAQRDSSGPTHGFPHRAEPQAVLVVIGVPIVPTLRPESRTRRCPAITSSTLSRDYLEHWPSTKSDVKCVPPAFFIDLYRRG
nr:hypothetical protein EU244_31275 [Rhodococcus qingshengii]